VSSLYNPYAAVPSMHIGYALIVAGTLIGHGRHRLVRALGALYAPFVLLVVVATGNHFLFDAAAGALVAALAAAAAALLTGRVATGCSTAAVLARGRRPPDRRRGRTEKLAEGSRSCTQERIKALFPGPL
jgi:PAP2 superfamily